MKTTILKWLMLSLTVTLIIVSCDKESEVEKCVLQNLGIAHDSYWLLEFNDNGTIASATSVFNGTENERYDYSYTSDKISIYLTNLVVSNQLACEIGIDSQGRPIYRTHDGQQYEKLVYINGRLDHSLWNTKDSLVYRYSDSNNPDALDFYGYNPSDQTWTFSHTTNFTYDNNPNPLKGLILPTPDWNVNGFLHENNQTSYSAHEVDWFITYTYNAQGYPVTRTLTSPDNNFSETTGLEYKCE
jgi:hypothetical protein